MNRVLISHAVEDEPVASLLKSLIERCSLRRFEVWFSSDRSAIGGVPIGTSWLLDLLKRLNDTDVVVALVTPLSVSSPWLYFECGYGASRHKTSVVPLALGMPLSEIPMPLAAYQGYDLALPTSIDEFLEKLFASASVPFDEEMTRSIRSKVSRQFVALAPQYYEKRSLSDSRSNLEQLRQFLERRFVDLYALVPQLQKAPIVYKCHFEVWKEDNNVQSFTIPVDSNMDTVMGITDRCYFKIETLVKPFAYLETWLLRESDTQRRIVIKEISDIVPARYVFKPGQTYRLELLDSPYDPSSGEEFS